MPVMLVMAVLVTVIMVMFVFKINPLSSFNVIGTACININRYSRRRRQMPLTLTFTLAPGSPGRGG